MARILAQRRQSRGVNQDQAVLAKLGLSDLQNAADEVDIGAIQTKRFARSQAGAREQADQRRQGAPSLRDRGGELAACRKEGGKLLIAQDTRRWNGAGPGKGTTIERFGSRVVDGEILAETAEHSMTIGATVGCARKRQGEVERHTFGERTAQLPGLHVPHERS